MNRNITTATLEEATRRLIGMDRFVNTLYGPYDDPTFPKYNLIRKSENEWVVEMALAGFAREDLSVTIERGDLVVKGAAKESEHKENEFLHRGIATRAFTRSFTMSDYVEVSGATYEDGILRISLKRNEPEHLKAKTIAIG